MSGPQGHDGGKSALGAWKPHVMSPLVRSTIFPIDSRRRLFLLIRAPTVPNTPKTHALSSASLALYRHQDCLAFLFVRRQTAISISLPFHRNALHHHLLREVQLTCPQFDLRLQ